MILGGVHHVLIYVNPTSLNPEFLKIGWSPTSSISHPHTHTIFHLPSPPTYSVISRPPHSTKSHWHIRQCLSSYPRFPLKIKPQRVILAVITPPTPPWSNPEDPPQKEPPHHRPQTRSWKEEQQRERRRVRPKRRRISSMRSVSRRNMRSVKVVRRTQSPEVSWVRLISRMNGWMFWEMTSRWGMKLCYWYWRKGKT